MKSIFFLICLSCSLFKTIAIGQESISGPADLQTVQNDKLIKFMFEIDKVHKFLYSRYNIVKTNSDNLNKKEQPIFVNQIEQLNMLVYMKYLSKKDSLRIE